MNHLNLNEKFSKWLKSRNWQLHNFQKDFFQLLQRGKNRQYIISSDIGTGKTITAFLPFFNDYCHGNMKKVLYISPLRSINTSLEENLKKIVRELNIKCNIEKRTSDDSYLKKKKTTIQYTRDFINYTRIISAYDSKSRCYKIIRKLRFYNN